MAEDQRGSKQTTELQSEDGGWFVAREIKHDRPGWRPRFDEIVTGPVDSVHIEQLADGLYWMAIYKGDQCLAITFSSLNGRSHVAGRYEVEST